MSSTAGEVERVLRLFVDLGVVMPFRWPDWDGASRYRSGRGLADAPVADAARLATAIVGADRFCDGTVAATLADGTLRAVLDRLRRWFDEERQQFTPGSASGRGSLYRPTPSPPSPRSCPALVAIPPRPQRFVVAALAAITGWTSPVTPRRKMVAIAG